MKLRIDFYDFRDSDAPLADVATALDIATIAAEAIHGEDRVRIETRCDLDPRDRCVKIDTGTVVGRHVSRTFAGSLRPLSGATAFAIDRLESATAEEPEPQREHRRCRNCGGTHHEHRPPREPSPSLNGHVAPRGRHADEAHR